MDSTIAINAPAGGRELPLAVRRLFTPGPRFELHRSGAGDRALAERYIADRFASCYGARITEFLPWLVTMDCGTGLSAAAGLKPAANGQLFLEHYLSSPIEQCIEQHRDREVARGSIAEIGNLAATHRGASQVLFLFLAALLHEAGFRWVAFTATPKVRNSLDRLGLPLIPLADADPARLEADASDWGTYYETRPAVCVGDLASAIDSLDERTLLAAAFGLFKPRAAELSTLMARGNGSHAHHTFTA